MQKDLIDNLKVEYKELIKKIDSLEKFFQYKNHKKLNEFQKNLLVMQHIFMCAYCNILAQRILDLQGDPE